MDTSYCLLSAAISIDRQTLLVCSSNVNRGCFPDIYYPGLSPSIDNMYWSTVQTMCIAVASPTSIVQDNIHRWTTYIDLMFKPCILLLLPRHLLFRAIAIDEHFLLVYCSYNLPGVLLLLPRHLLFRAIAIDEQLLVVYCSYNLYCCCFPDIYCSGQ